MARKRVTKKRVEGTGEHSPKAAAASTTQSSLETVLMQQPVAARQPQQAGATPMQEHPSCPQSTPRPRPKHTSIFAALSTPATSQPTSRPVPASPAIEVYVEGEDKGRRQFVVPIDQKLGSVFRHFEKFANPPAVSREGPQLTLFYTYRGTPVQSHHTMQELGVCDGGVITAKWQPTEVPIVPP